MSLHALASHMATKGRGGDSMLVHMTPEEVQSLQAMALKGGGSLTINPDTGLPEANFLKKLLPMIAGLALNYFVPGLGAAVGGAFGLGAAAGTGIAVGGITSLATGSLSRGLMAGLGAYGGASLVGGAQALGSTAVAPEAIAAANASPDAIMSLTAAKDAATMAAEGFAGAGAGAGTVATGANAAKQGLSMAANNPGSFVNAMGGPAKTLGAAYAAATPMMADQMVPTATDMPDTGPSYIRPYIVDQYTQRMQALDPIDASTIRLPKQNFAGGGIVALAAGGTAPAYFAANPDVAAAYAEESYGLSPEQFAQTHYERYGADEQRASPTPAQAGVDAFQIGAGQGAAAANYLKTNTDVADWLNSAEGKSWAAMNPGYDASDIAYTHYVKYGADEGRKWGAPTPTAKPFGNSTGAAPTPGDLTRNPNGTVTVHPNIPGRPAGGFTGMQQVKDAYTAGGGSLGYTPYAPATLQEFQDRYTNMGGSKQAYDYLMNKGEADVKRPVTKTGGLMLPYHEVMGLRRPDPIPMRRKPDEKKEEAVFVDGSIGGANGGLMPKRMALGGLGSLAGGGQAGYNLGGYSDGGRLLRGPGDGVSDSIPATIGDRQPARLADGEFVVPARIVSELGNGSTEAGARKLYAMMDRVQKARGKTTGKNRVAANTRSEKYLPA
jgi:hypothetical protein